jgi:hypothetical protein
VKKIITGFVALLWLGITACSTEVETNAPYQEIPVVYGVLNPDSAFQYIRITKGFLNNNGEDARVIAKTDTSQLYYKNGELDVKLISTTTRDVTDTLATFTEVVNTAKQADGDFAYPEQKLYRSVNRVLLNQPLGTIYQIVVTNKLTGKQVKATTNLVGGYTINSPSEINPSSPINNFDFRVEGKGASNFIAISPAPNNATIFKANLRINVREVYSDGSIKDTSILWANVASPLIVGTNNTINRDIETNGFFELLLSTFKSNDGIVSREFLPSEFLFYAGNSDFQKYLDLLNNYSPVSQTRPIYNNISGGLGLWTSVRNKRIPIRISNNTVNEMNFVEFGSARRPDLFALKFKTI